MFKTIAVTTTVIINIIPFTFATWQKDYIELKKFSNRKRNLPIGLQKNLR
jgi:hypothetical protein